MGWHASTRGIQGVRAKSRVQIGGEHSREEAQSSSLGLGMNLVRAGSPAGVRACSVVPRKPQKERRVPLWNPQLDIGDPVVGFEHQLTANEFVQLPVPR
jgi:hypothetical protein